MKYFYCIYALIFAIVASPAQTTKPIYYVNPMIGTGGHGHTFPGATAPFGMVQLSPDTRLDGWDGCSAYHYSDSVVYGFSHTHLSGTGCSDYGDILLMPIAGKVSLRNTEYSSHFSHKNEIAKAGFYSVKLDKYNILAELTATKRVGVHRYTFNGVGERNLLIDLVHRDFVLNSRLQQLNDSIIIGFRHSTAWAKNQQLFFAIKFSEKLKNFKIYNDILAPFISPKPSNNFVLKTFESSKLKAICTFNSKCNRPLEVYVALSAISAENALMNLESEMKNLNFDKAKEQVQNEWNRELSKIIVEGKNENDKIKFYTALYHCMIQPNLYSDVNGEYRGTDKKVHKADFDYYTVFSLWDTYRAYHPLMTIIDQKRTNDWIKTFLKQFDDGGILPVWELSGNETYCMIGYHSVAVIADAIMKDIGNFDQYAIFKAMKHSAMKEHLGLKEYREYNFIPGDLVYESVSKTLEYSFDDWCISQVAKKLGKIDDYNTFSKRAQFYKNVFDPNTKFMRARLIDDWYKPFDPIEVNKHYTEANSWQYSFYVPQDINTLIDMHGGKKALYLRLNEMFTTDAKIIGAKDADISGMMGQYAHGNEPSHHIAYLFNYVNNPSRTQELVRKIMSDLYSSNPDGLAGNEDCGQMSAWFVMSAMGFYSVCPGDTNYLLGSPLFDKVTISLENGNSFIINAKDNSESNIYVQSATLNGQKYTRSYLSHFDIMQGGEFSLQMGPERSQFAVLDMDCPISRIQNSILPNPTINSKERLHDFLLENSRIVLYICFLQFFVLFRHWIKKKSMIDTISR